MRRFVIASVWMVALIGIAQIQAAVITFSAVATESGHSIGWWGNPSINYQPLMGGYVVGAITDGGNLGITVNMTGFITDQSGHTGDAPTDYFLKGWSNSNPYVMTFDQPVVISSFWVNADYNSGASGATFNAYTLTTDSSPAGTFNVTNTNGNWVQVTAMAAYPLTKLTMNLPSGNILFDDMTIAAVPEPATLALLGLGGLTLVRVRGRRRRA